MLPKNYKIGLMLFETFHGRRNIGSSRIRGRWLAKYWDDAEVFVMGQKYDSVIYQKAYWVEHAKAFNGIKIFDLCDPDFLHFGYRTMEMINECDAVTTSTKALKKTIERFTDKPVVFIPDRMDLSYHSVYKQHTGEAKTLVWFGYNTNFELLNTTIPYLSKNNLDLIVISNKDYVLPVGFENNIKLTNYRWNVDTVNRNIIKGDIVLNPKAENGRWKYKSNNKTITSYLLGMPVATSPEEIERYSHPEVRQEVSIKTKELAEKEYDIKLSVDAYKKLINKLKNEKKI